MVYTLLFALHLYHINIRTSYFFPGAGTDVWFSLRDTTYQNNSIVILENIGDGDDALLCMTNLTACCQTQSNSGNWLFPNGTRVPSLSSNWDFYRTRGHMVVRLSRRGGGVEGIYHCQIPDAMNVLQTIYIGVYSANTGEWYIHVHSCSVPKTSLGLAYKE